MHMYVSIARQIHTYIDLLINIYNVYRTDVKTAVLYNNYQSHHHHYICNTHRLLARVIVFLALNTLVKNIMIWKCYA